jgi:hypothetical protein
METGSTGIAHDVAFSLGCGFGYGAELGGQEGEVAHGGLEGDIFIPGVNQQCFTGFHIRDIPSGHSKIMCYSRGRDHTVYNRHGFSRHFSFCLHLSPDSCCMNIKRGNPSLEPFLKVFVNPLQQHFPPFTLGEFFNAFVNFTYG